ncbi:helix-turn-helix transcriptional regulator [Oscillatoriales cyanobacterium LEGE 11467]|uniref:Helix-turn-helix transcriptional regulator n=1 Tax=Zarconia navalis LEGE 11467 TaxID=1828826 RepID=A0A928VZF4_9CYAN|nr:helix-turn-helix transcriptional regulator [Zarconia navalis]MBE9042449.1 helix-turn-helix transcriptional regulator [Zarconia navalis LEGE 11467]
MDSTKPQSKISQLREQAELTQLELSQLVGVTETTIANWEKGRSGLEWIERLIRLCNALDCQPQDLIEYIPAAESSEPQAKPKTKTLSQLRQLLNTDRPPQSNPAKPTIQSNGLEVGE